MRRSRTLSTVVLILVAAGLVALALGGYLTPLTRLGTQPWLVVQEWLAVRYAALRDYLTAPQDVAVLRARNQALEAEVARLQAEVADLQQQLIEAQTLAALLDFARAHPSNRYKAARVIGHDPSPFLHYIIINRGSDDGIRPGMPVVSATGLVGYVDAVIPRAARVRLITDAGSRVDVRLKPTKVDAVLQGSLTGELTLTMLPLNAEVPSGTLVFTSGLGGRFPPDILVGQVVSTRKIASALFQEAAVQPATDFNRLDIVLVVVNFQPIDLTPLQETQP